MPTKEGCTNLPEPESRFRRSVSVSVPPPFTKVAAYSICVRAAGGEPSSPETSTFGSGEAFLRLTWGSVAMDEKSTSKAFFCVNRGDSAKM